MARLDKVMTYACIDINDDLPLAKLITQLSVDAGVDIVESGTPLVYSTGYESIEELRKVVGPDFPVVVDYKAQDGCGSLFRDARRHGADYASVSVVNNDGGLKAAMEAKKECGIKVIADLFAVPLEDLPKRAKECEAMGVDIVLIHFGFDENTLGVWPGRRDCDGVKEVVEAVNIPVAVVANELEDVEQAIKDGADWIVFGLMLTDTSRETYLKCKNFVEKVHEFDCKYNNRPL